MRPTALAVVAVSLAGCSLLIDLDPVPGVIDGSSETSTDAAQADADAGNDVVVDAATDGEDPNDCGVQHHVCNTKQCINGDCVRRIFVSKEGDFTGQFAGITGADTDCRNICNTQNLGDCIAVMSAVDAAAIDRVGLSNAPFLLMNDAEVAPNSKSLFGGSLEHPVDITEDGTNTSIGNVTVWTGTAVDGTTETVSTRCGDWSSMSGTAGYGVTAATDGGGWLYTGTTGCGGSAHIYCVEHY